MNEPHVSPELSCSGPTLDLKMCKGYVCDQEILLGALGSLHGEKPSTQSFRATQTQESRLLSARVSTTLSSIKRN